MSDKLNKDDGFYSEISKLNFGNKPWNIIQSGTGMTLQAEINQILTHIAEVAQTFGITNYKGDTAQVYNADDVDVIAESLQAILAIVSKHLPEKRKKDLNSYSEPEREYWNYAITKMEETLGPDHE